MATDTVTESKHTLRIFLAMTGDIPVSDIASSHMRVFLDAVRWWPERATIKPAFRGMSVKEIVAAASEKKAVAPKYWLPHTQETWSGRGRTPRAFAAWEGTAAFKDWKAAHPNEKFPKYPG